MKARFVTAGTLAVALGLFLGFTAPTHPASAGLDGADLPDPEVEVQPSVDHLLSGSGLTYRITISNEDDVAAAPFRVANQLPDETTFVSCTSTGTGRCGGTGTSRSITFDTLAPGTNAVADVAATVACSVPDGTEIYNTADVVSSLQDAKDDEVENETAFVTVDNPPPAVVGLRADPAVLWPPDHKWTGVTIAYTVLDHCGPVDTRLEVTSNEAINGTGDGDASPDWELVDAHHLRLRAERAGNGSGRVYTVTVVATDSAGQVGRAATEVRVPHGRKGS